MFGIETYQFISFLRQFGLAIAGAASLWGMVFMYLGNKKEQNDPASIILIWIGLRLRWLVYGGSILAIGSWVVFIGLSPAYAHEGVTLISSFGQYFRAAENLFPVYVSLLVLLCVGLIKKDFKLSSTRKGISWFYLCSFILISIAISHYTDFQGLSSHQIIFHIFHGFHSIFTLGTVIVLDFMFLSSRSSSILQQHIFPLFPQISKVIWVGLSLDLLSVLLIYPEAVILSPRFFFAQTVVAILIINGVLLSGVITRRVLTLINSGQSESSKRWILFSNIAGTISVTSWMSITFVDFFPNITFSYPELMGIYVLIICTLFVLHEIWDYFDKESPL